jgi:hypothetical protein
LRLGFIFLGIFILLWLPVEDSSLTLVLTISVCTSILGVLALLSLQLQRWASAAQEGETGLQDRQGRKAILVYPLAGMLAGVAVTLAAIAWMAIKTGVHGHGAPDYTPAQVSLVIRLAPLWVGLGLITGVLAAIGRR